MVVIRVSVSLFPFSSFFTLSLVRSSLSVVPSLSVVLPTWDRPADNATP